jgi:hypothetical protein
MDADFVNDSEGNIGIAGYSGDADWSAPRSSISRTASRSIRNVYICDINNHRVRRIEARR